MYNFILGDVNINVNINILENSAYQQEEKEIQNFIKHGIADKWQPKKIENMELVKKYEKIGNINKALRLRLCGRWLEYAVNGELKKIKLVKASSCHVRLCPICAWRRSLNVFRNLSAVYAEDRKQHKHIFLTLTQKNVTAEELDGEIQKISKGFLRLIRFKELKEIVQGYTRCIEITYNKRSNTYHPHIHAILSVKKSYGGKYYLPQKFFVEKWQKILELDYLPIVDIRKIEQLNGKSVAEIAKYSIKSVDYLENGADIEILDKVLDGKRLISYGGCIRKLKQQILKNEIEEENNQEFEDWKEWERIIYEWHFETEMYRKLEV